MIVTHKHPDLDCIFAIWLLKRHCGFEGHAVRFRALDVEFTHAEGDVLEVDIGGGELDHHGSAALISASSLVAEKFSLLSDPVIADMVQIVTRIDHGYLDKKTARFRNLVEIIAGLNRLHPEDPLAVLHTTHLCLDALHIEWSSNHAASREIHNGIRFHTRWGSGLAIVTTNSAVRWLAHRQGIPVFVFIDPNTGVRGIAAVGGRGIDLTPQYQYLSRIEPEANWYLHLTKDLLLCGSRKTEDKRLSNLPLDCLIHLVADEGLS